MNSCNEWKTEKHNECANVAQLQTTEIMMAAVADVGTMVVFKHIKCA
jgi:hypothetical protein